LSKGKAVITPFQIRISTVQFESAEPIDLLPGKTPPVTMGGGAGKHESLSHLADVTPDSNVSIAMDGRDAFGRDLAYRLDDRLNLGHSRARLNFFSPPGLVAKL
jgi:hypothetical protein